MAAIPRPRFYALIAISLALFTIIGFSRTYYFRFLTDLPPLTVLVQLHGAVFTAWLLVFVAHDWRRHRLVHPVYAIGGLAIVALWPLRLVAGRSEWHQPVGEWITRVGAGM